uniref:angiopoietin-4-like n=1 Tax=Styela clava TaxID=7725 RepID=UPI001939DA18|nr:angiopoietin-4-like [Styela clava]
MTVFKDQIALMLQRVLELENIIQSAKQEINGTGQFKIPIKHPSVDVFRDCSEIFKRGHLKSGVYMIQIFHGFYPISIYCDMSSPGVFSGKRGWMTIQRRINGEVNFDRSWHDYLHGFGLPDKEHWIGLQNILRLTEQKRTGKYDNKNLALRIDVEDWDGITGFIEYNDFRLSSEEFDFELSGLGRFAGTNSIKRHLGFSISSPFSTYDHNNDRLRSEACVKSQRGGWWFGYCSHMNLNGIHSESKETMSDGKIFIQDWRSVNERNTALRYISMKLQ